MTLTLNVKRMKVRGTPSLGRLCIFTEYFLKGKCSPSNSAAAGRFLRTLLTRRYVDERFIFGFRFFLHTESIFPCAFLVLADDTHFNAGNRVGDHEEGESKHCLQECRQERFGLGMFGWWIGVFVHFSFLRRSPDHLRRPAELLFVKR